MPAVSFSVSKVTTDGGSPGSRVATNNVASASPKDGRMTLPGKLNCANRDVNRFTETGWTRSAPQMIASTSPRSSPARSSSVVRAAARSRAKLGAAVSARVRSAICCNHGAGQEGDGAHHDGMPAAENGRADAEDQTHVVIEGQPGHHRRSGRSHLSV